jgi:hypothetical protein
MNSATDYRKQADACRRAASLSKGQHPTPYLIDLAKDYELRAAQLEARLAGHTSGADKQRDSK